MPIGDVQEAKMQSCLAWLMSVRSAWTTGEYMLAATGNDCGATANATISQATYDPHEQMHLGKDPRVEVNEETIQFVSCACTRMKNHLLTGDIPFHTQDSPAIKSKAANQAGTNTRKSYLREIQKETRR